ncbi:DUF2116 family Zn-ribbon domain-containing protein [Mucilaginibacter sp. BJC16-A38]|uniref:DUF2116 family Zn-ribbon domain-containing protein n=1 Tax=Mucilaginibacter phenanthrenivorans TaxID=1234842 RepID=UPI0021588A6D|nr:DUF2116 family Zn-ribbon domain-containing protein [Mucilaginibacter phenanthrenivorans]MCR8556923.1 DUF2116 family Zn-ribbon domain-containing protein [Mucilaginibacter phenanthrenivorans]
MPTLRSEAIKHCENCGKELFGRTDKRFCNDGCRNQFNREKAAREKQKAHDNLPEIFKIIKRNYEILQGYSLKGLHEDEAIFTDTWRLKEQGFNFKFFTSQVIERDGERINCCFEFGWYEEVSSTCSMVYRPRQAKI